MGKPTPPSILKWVLTLLLLGAAVPAAHGGSLILDLGRGAVVVWIPDSYDPQSPTPVVLLLHGYGASGPAQESYMQFLPLSEEFGFIYAYPNGTVDSGGSRFWNATDACCNFFGSTVDDSGYLRALIEEIQAQLNVDPARIYLIGHSNGGFMSYRMACDHPDLIAAIASLAGATFENPDDCAPAGPVHVLQIHGTQDSVILYNGGNIGGNFYPGAIETVEQWAAFDGCAPGFDIGTPLDLDSSIPGDETTVRIYDSGCSEGGSAELWSIVGGSHVPVLSPDFSRNVVEFLLAHPKFVTTFRRGDVNGDGGLDVADPVAALDHLFGGAPVDCVLALDANDDEGADIGDPVYLLSYLFGGGPPVPPPSMACGEDPTPTGQLDCAVSNCP